MKVESGTGLDHHAAGKKKELFRGASFQQGSLVKLSISRERWESRRRSGAVLFVALVRLYTQHRLSVRGRRNGVLSTLVESLMLTFGFEM